MLFDTNVLLWLFRGNLKALKIIQSDNDRRISVVTYMELLQGARNQQELKNIKNLLIEFNIGIVPLSENTGYRASIYMEEYVLKTALYLADALIVATAVEDGFIHCTGNLKHYRMIKDFPLKQFNP